MSSYRGRNNVNVSQFLANLNTIQPVEEQVVDTFNPDDLALFTNTQFFDFDIGDQQQQIEELSPASSTYESQTVAPQQAKRSRVSKDEFNADDAIDSFLGAGFDYDYSSILQTGLPDQHLHSQPPVTNVVAPAMPLSTHTGFHHEAPFPIPPTNIAAPVHSQPPTPSTLVFPSPINTGKRKASSVDPMSPECLEEASRMAAEEDKRRRNTAASARFRIKKKQREQALERSAKEMADKVSSLESKITQLEMENKWLKNLITEKNTGKKDELDISELYKAKFSAAASAPAPLLKDNKSTI